MSEMVYAKSGNRKIRYSVQNIYMFCWTQAKAHQHPQVRVATPAKYRWHTLMGSSYGQYWPQESVGGVLFTQ